MGHSEFIKDRPDYSKEISFADRPLLIDGTEVRSIIMREPTVDDQIIAQRAGGVAEAEVQLIANLVEQSPETIRALPLPLYTRLQEAVSVFLA